MKKETKKALLSWGIILALVGVGSAMDRVFNYLGRDKETTRATVESRLEAFGPAVAQRFAPFFEKAGVPYPPARLVLVGLKEERMLEVYAAGADGPLRFIRAYPVLGASGTLGPKLREGDRQVPEGFYAIEYLNPNSSYHLSMKLSYPNAEERAHAEREGRTEPGSDIMIHGDSVSIGCLAMGDEAAEDLFILGALTGVKAIEVMISPVDFRVRELPKAMPPVPEWAAPLYTRLREALAGLPAREG